MKKVPMKKVLMKKVLTKKPYYGNVLQVIKIGLRVVLTACRRHQVIENIALDEVVRLG